jgi:hypothetical protein
VRTRRRNPAGRGARRRGRPNLQLPCLSAPVAAQSQRQPTLAQAARDQRREVERTPAIAMPAVGVQFVRARVQAGDRAEIDHGRKLAPRWAQGVRPPRIWSRRTDRRQCACEGSTGCEVEVQGAALPDLNWSERRDSNSGPLAPHASALPDCATLRPGAEYSVLGRWLQPCGKDAPLQRRRILISSSSSTRSCRASWCVWVTSTRASSPSRRLRAPPIVKPWS